MVVSPEGRFPLEASPRWPLIPEQGAGWAVLNKPAGVPCHRHQEWDQKGRTDGRVVPVLKVPFVSDLRA